MFYRAVFVCFVGFVLVKLVKMDPPVITFHIQTVQGKDSPLLTCDHSKEKLEQNLYTVYEENNFTIVTKYNRSINYVICHALTDENMAFKYIDHTTGNVEITFTAEKRMGTAWKCAILAHREIAEIQPLFEYRSINYSAAYCYMRIHVRQKVATQMILVNNMEMQAVRTNSSQEDADFIAEYQYEDDDVVKVICMNKRGNNMLTMEYNMAGTMSDESTMNDLESSKMIGFSTRLHSGHNNSYMICTRTDEDDYNKVMLRFAKRTTRNYISVNINGDVLRQYLANPPSNHYEIVYKYVINQYINVVCAVNRTDVKFLVFDNDLVKLSNYHKEETPRMARMSFYFGLTRKADKADKKVSCAIDTTTGRSVETLQIHFTAGDFPIEQYKLKMELPSNATVMELFNDYKLNVIFYEFKDGETLQLSCGHLVVPTTPGPVLYLQLSIPGERSVICETNGCPIRKNMQVTRKYENKIIVCSLKEKNNPSDPSSRETVHRKIKLILRERVLTTTTTSTTTTTTSTIPASKGLPTQGDVSSNWSSKLPAPSKGTEEKYTWLDNNIMKLAIISCCAVFIIIICACIVIVKLRKRTHLQGDPHSRNYENLPEPSEGTIPAYPPQWENNYAVPVDQRTEDITYSVPCPPADLYATPTPKSLRNKKQNPIDPTYAVLAVPSKRDQKNKFKETEDPNYSEVYANSSEACYAKVQPKSQRNIADQDNPYSYVTNDRPMAFTADPEPMYCEPGKARGAEYANLNNSQYVNSNAPEYVEPTYCEPQKRMK